MGSSKGYALLARVDWLMLLAIAFPMQFYAPISLLFSDHSNLFWMQLITSTAEAIFLGGFLIIVGVVVDKIRVTLSPPTILMEGGTCKAIETTLANRGINVAQYFIRRMHVIKGDLTLGAHVRGILKPYIVISGGMLVGLRRGDQRAISILCHELAHISHHDRLLPMYMGLAVIEGIGTTYKVVIGILAAELGSTSVWLTVTLLAVYKIVILSLQVSMISKYREFYADARASKICSQNNAYLELLSHSEGRELHRFSFFHPSLAKRITELEGGFPIVKKAWFWRVFLTLHVIVSWTIWVEMNVLSDELPFEAYYAQASIFVALACLGITFFRGLLLRAGAKKSDEFSSPKRISIPVSVWRYIFLLIGFTFVVVTSEMAGGEGGSMWISIGGAVVYAIFVATKPKH